jgi:hypothetical protein
MTKTYNFEICFICRFPTTDFSPNESGEPICGLCWSETPSDEEVDLVFAAMHHDWTSEELEDFYQQIHE